MRAGDTDLQQVQAHNAQNTLIPTTKYERDALGNVTKITDALGNQESFQYNKKSQLIEKIDKEGYLTTYKYNPTGEVQQIQYADGKEVRLSYNALRQLEEIEDWLGITRIENNARGQAMVENENARGFTQPYNTYTGYQKDSVANTYYAQAREYTPMVGRFTGEDVIKGNGAYPFTLNQYAYCWNHPMSLVDLDGEMPILPHQILLMQYHAKEVTNEIGKFWNTHIYGEEIVEIGEDETIDDVVGVYLRGSVSHVEKSEKYTGSILVKMTAALAAYSVFTAQDSPAPALGQNVLGKSECLYIIRMVRNIIKTNIFNKVLRIEIEENGWI